MPRGTLRVFYVVDARRDPDDFFIFFVAAVRRHR
jgi:hypothetical protein